MKQNKLIKIKIHIYKIIGVSKKYLSTGRQFLLTPFALRIVRKQ